MKIHSLISLSYLKKQHTRVRNLKKNKLKTVKNAFIISSSSSLSPRHILFQ